MIIRLYDDEIMSFNHLIEIKDDSFGKFEKLLKDYKEKHKNDYNYEDFTELLSKKKYFIKFICVDVEVYF